MSVLNELRALRENDCNSIHHLGLPFTKEELDAVLKATQSYKAPGPDSVTQELWRNYVELAAFLRKCMPS